MTFDIKQLSKRYAVSSSTVTSWIRNGELAACCVSRSPSSRKPRYRVTEAALADFEALRAAVPVPPKATRRRKATGDDQIIQFYK